MPSKGADSLVHTIRFIGRSQAAVKSLSGFKKSHHTVPDAVNPATMAFLAKLCGDDLRESAEGVFQNTREALAYKRKQISLEVLSPGAVLATKDFVLEWLYAFDEADPAFYVVTRTLRDLRSHELLLTPEFEKLFAGAFAEIVFALKRSVPVEVVIDAVEDANSAHGMKIDYPSDCRQCSLMVAGVSATVIFDGADFRMVFPRAGSPSELLASFEAVRSAFNLTKNRALEKLFST